MASSIGNIEVKLLAQVLDGAPMEIATMDIELELTSKSYGLSVAVPDIRTSIADALEEAAADLRAAVARDGDGN